MPSCQQIVIVPIYGQFGAIRKPNSERIVCKTYIFNNRNLLSYEKCWNQQNYDYFGTKRYIFQTYICVCTYKFHVSSIILMNFRQRVRGRGVVLLPFPPQNEPPKNPTQFIVNLDRAFIAFADWLFIESVSLVSNWQQYFLNSLALNNLSKDV